MPHNKPETQQDQQNPQVNQAPQGEQNQQKAKKELPPIKKEEFKANGDFIDSLPKKITAQLKKYTPEDLRNRMESDPDNLMHELMQEATIPKQDLDDEYIKNMINDMLPGYKIPEKEVMEKRELQREQLGQKLYQTILKKHILLRIYGQDGNAHDRQEQLFFDYTGKSDNPEESNKLTEEFLNHKTHKVKIPSSKDPKIQEEFQKKSAEYIAEDRDIFLRQMKAFNNFNLSNIDPLDPQSILDNAEEALFIASFGFELDTIMKDIYKKSPEVLDRYEMIKFTQRAPEMYEYGQTLKQTMEMMINPLYNYLGLFDDPDSMHIDFDRNVGDKDKPQTLYDKYCGSNYLTKNSPYTLKYNGTLSNIGYLSKANSLSPYLDRSLTIGDRAEKAHEAKQYKYGKQEIPKDPERKVGNAEPDSFNEHLDLPKISDPETESILKILCEGEGTAGINDFDYKNRDLYSRVYAKDENNYFVPAFPDAEKKGWKGPTEEELYKLAHSDKNIGYFQAGSDEFYIVQGKETYRAKVLPDPILFGKEAKRRILKDFSADETKRYESEAIINQLKRDLNGFERVKEYCVSIFGSKMENKGNNNFRSFEQRYNKYFSEQPGTVYPTTDSDRQLLEDDIAVLTMLNMTTPKISGNEMPGATAEVSIIRTFNMSISDFFTNRSDPEKVYWKPAIRARQDMAKKLEAYYSDGDMTDIAATIADGFHFMTESCQNRGELSGSALSASIPLLMTMEMLKRGSNQQLLEKTKDIIKARGQEAFDTFEKDWEKAETLCNIYRLRNKGFESELKLLRYKNGQLTDDQGNVLDPEEKEREQLEADVKKSNFLSEIGVKHKNLCRDKMSTDAVKSMLNDLKACQEKAKELLDKEQKETGRPYTEDDLKNKKKDLEAAVTHKVEVANSTRPMSPVYTILLEHPQGQKVLDAMLKETPNTKELYQRLEDEGLIPPKGGLDEYDIETYDHAIDLYSKWIDAEPQFKKDWDANKDFFQEQGMEYDDVSNLMKSGQITNLTDYRKDIEVREREMEMNRAVEIGIPKEKELNKIAKMFSKTSEQKLSASDICKAFKTLNTISEKRQGNQLIEYVASRLMTKVCKEMNNYMSKSPEHQNEIHKRLNSDDFKKAAYTINRGDAVKKEVEEKIQSRNNEGMSKNGNTKQHVFNK